MSDDDAFELLALDSFEWDDRKSQANVAKHGISFEDASEIFYSATLVRRSPRNDEERWIAIGEVNGRIISTIFARRNNSIRIISARHPRPNEESTYRNAQMGRPSQRED